MIINFISYFNQLLIMSFRNIIPAKIPPDIWNNGMGEIDDIILFALGSYSPIARSEFITDNKIRRMNKNTFHNHAKELKKKSYINSYREGKNSYYIILPLGENELSNRLIKYGLDFETRLEIIDKKNRNLANKFLKFFQDNEIRDSEVQLEYLKLATLISHEKLREIYSEQEFNKLILFLTFNHPRFYEDYSINNKNFIEKYNKKSEGKLSINNINTFIELVVDKEKYGIKFHKLKVDTKELYFAENSHYGEIFKTIVDNKLMDLIFLKNLGYAEINYLYLENTYNDIVNHLIEDLKLFHRDLYNSLFQLIDDYRNAIKQQIIRRFSDEKVQYTAFSLLPEREIKPKQSQITGKIKIEKLNELRLLLEISKTNEALSVLNQLLSLGYDDDLLYKLAELIADVMKRTDVGVADLIYKKISNLYQDFDLILGDYYFFKSYEALSEKDYNKVLDLYYKSSMIVREDHIGILKNYYSALIGLGYYDRHIVEEIEDIEKNWEKYGQYIDGELFLGLELPTEDASELLIEDDFDLLTEENYKKSILYTFGILKTQLLLKKGDYNESLQVIEDLFNLDIKTPRLYSLIAMNQVNLEQYDEAFDTVAQGLNIDPTNAKLIQIKANILFKLHRYNDALDTINQAIELDPHFEEPDSPKNFVLKAWILFYKDELNEALKIVNNAYQKFPDLPDLKEIGSLIYDLKGEPLGLVEKAEEKGEDISLYNKAQLLKNIEKYDLALETINKAINQDPEDALNYDMKAIILTEMECYDEALENINKSIEMQPEDQGFKSIKEQILQRLALFNANQGKKEEAIEIIQKAIENYPDSKSYDVFGEILMLFKDYKKAIDKLEFAKTRPFTPVETYIKLGKCYIELDQKEKALENLEKGKSEAERGVTKAVLLEGERVEWKIPLTDLIEEAEKLIEEISSYVRYVFITKFISRDGKRRYYTNYTSNLYEALEELKNNPPENIEQIELKYFEIFRTRDEAIKRTQEIDSLSNKEKEDLIKTIEIKF